MNKKLIKIYRKYLKIPILTDLFMMLLKIKNTIFNIGNKKQCFVCKKKFNHFGKFREGIKGFSKFLKNLDLVGSDVENYRCYFCGSNDRVRHLFMFFDKLKIWGKIKNSKILHFAPELQISEKIRTLNPKEYTMADLFPKDEKCKEIDVTQIPFENESIDIIICNHVLEHVIEYEKALREIYRVLKINGIAILQTPYSRLIEKNFEENNINTDELRLFFYAQEDHVRMFSEKQFFQDLEKTGFKLKIIKHSDLFNHRDADYFGVNKEEELIQVLKGNEKVV